MGEMQWQGHEFSAETLFEAAREARLRGWLDEASRLFLHRMGLCLAAGGAPGPADRRTLHDVLDALRLRGSFTLAALRTGLTGVTGRPAPAEAPAPVAWTAPELPKTAAAQPASPVLTALESEIGRLSVLLATAAERLEACRAELALQRRSNRSPAPPGLA